MVSSKRSASRVDLSTPPLSKMALGLMKSACGAAMPGMPAIAKGRLSV
ncbi:Uncharacterised protein [Vibrio cholerae]|nr:Uncharacterised protein [Vibrio cholerae]CSD76140.1 Uncharacterised protein [Vibrio cholerae]